MIQLNQWTRIPYAERESGFATELLKLHQNPLKLRTETAMPSTDDDTPLPFSLPNICKKKVTAAFDGGQLKTPFICIDILLVPGWVVPSFDSDR
jgi:hypothetical protein